jgi:predicted metal-dependent phosphoesterase TrpH
MFHADRVQFERPDLQELNLDYTLVDMHFHSHYSDGLNRIDAIADRARRLGIGVAITDHNDIRGALEMDQYTDVLSIPGIEITAAEGSHVLVYFYEARQLSHFYHHHVQPFMGQGVMSSLRLNLFEIIERTHAYKCLVIFPHPYCAMYTGVCNLQFTKEQLHQLLNMVDGVEVINANNLKKWNLKCTVLGFNLNKIMVGGSDGHCLSHMGRAVSFAKCPANRYDFLDAVHCKQNRVIGKEIAFLRKLTSNGLKLRSNLLNCQDLIEKNFRYSRIAINYKARAFGSTVRRKYDNHFRSESLRNYFNI